MNISYKTFLFSCALIVATGNAQEAKKSVFSAEQEAKIRDLAKETIESKIGKIDPMYIMENLDEAKDEMEKIEAEIKARNEHLEKLGKTIMKKENELKAMGTNTNMDKVREEKKTQILNLRAQGQAKSESLKEYMNRIQQEVQMRLFKKIQEATDEIGKEEEYCIIHAGGILYGAQGTDVTDKVIAKLNAKYREEKKKMIKPSEKSMAKPAMTNDDE